MPVSDIIMGAEKHMEIIPGLHLVKGRKTNCYLIVEPSGLTLIDTGLPYNHKILFAYLSHLGCQPKDFQRVIITHADGDHYGCLNDIVQASGAETYAHPIEAAAMRIGEQSRPLKLRGIWKILFKIAFHVFRPQPVEVDHLVKDGEIIPTFGGLHVMHTPGHTPGHISLYAENHNLLFAGDSMRSKPDGRLKSSRGNSTWDEEIALKSAQAQFALNPKIICPGHGPVIFTQPDGNPQ